MKLESLAKANLLSSKLQIAEEELKNLEKFLKTYEPLAPEEKENVRMKLFQSTSGKDVMLLAFSLRLEDPEIVLQLLQIIKSRKESQIAQFKLEIESL
jgi:hypothetical protein